MINSRCLLACGLVLGLTIGCASKSTPTTRPADKSTRTFKFLADANPSRSDMQLASATRRDITYLADDEREGRGLGTRGLGQSARYISNRFKKLGLQTLDGFDRYYQNFELPFGREIDPSTTLVMGDRDFELNKDFVPLGSSGVGAFEGEVVFAGYAINDDGIEFGVGETEKRKGYNDFAGMDVKGKVVLAMRYEPHDESGVSRFTGKKEDFSRNASINTKSRRAMDAGAVALILVNPPEFHDEQPGLQPFEPAARRSNAFPVLHVTTETANAMLKRAGQPDLKSIQRKIDQSVQSASTELTGVALKGEVKIETTSVKTRNVAAMLRGKGPGADEYVVIGAHYDHVGKGAIGAMPANRGQIHNGADDNASGTSALLQLAEEFSKLPPQPRSLVFVAFTAEESGLLGSQHFVENSPIPLDKVVAMLNLDMVGRVKDQTLYIGGAGTAEPFDPLLAMLDENSPLNFKDMGRGGRGPSDHASFSRKNIPVIFLFSGTHPDYHKPGDDIEKINYEGMAQIIHLSFDLIRNFAAMERAPYNDEFDNQRVRINRNGEDNEQRGPRVQLGIMPDYGEADQPGVIVGDTIAGTAAEEAGLQAGDRIIQLNDTRIDSLETLFEWLGEQKVGDNVTIQFVRDGQTMNATTKLKERE